MHFPVQHIMRTVMIINSAMLWVGLMAEATVKQVSLGDTVKLECDITVISDIMWFVLHPNATLLLATFTTVMPVENLVSKTQSGRFVPVYNKAVPTVDLTIWNITDGNLGLYYCGKWRDEVFEIGNGTRLTFTEHWSSGLGRSMAHHPDLHPHDLLVGSALCIYYMP
ncbi:hypothetical protein UPYG_G00088130 [Umbra pygmaea]|uniref:Immunoglobulin domain-containing protein n=1 Tax=Umbra pygmaea TaxID=75934 RepID=A0ABD0Y4H5_UMBPY